MTLIDRDGRLFGRFNLVDAAVVALLIVLIPLAYGTALLFRPATPRIESVTYVEPNLADQRLGHGSVLTAKLKVLGTGLNPMLRAFIGDSPALAFVFETPNAADVLVGPVAPGTHDLILMDGINEVARAPVSIASRVTSTVRAIGWLTDMDPEVAGALEVGAAFPATDPLYEIVALGPVRPGRQRMRAGQTFADLSRPNLREREAVLELRCDPARSDDPCGLAERSPAPVRLGLPGPTRPVGFALTELLPASPPRWARVEVSFERNSAALSPGDREAYLDERAAVVERVTPRNDGGATATLRLGLDETREGWRYRGRLVMPGAPFEFASAESQTTGRIVAVTLEPQETGE